MKAYTARGASGISSIPTNLMGFRTHTPNASVFFCENGQLLGSLRQLEAHIFNIGPPHAPNAESHSSASVVCLHFSALRTSRYRYRASSQEHSRSLHDAGLPSGKAVSNSCLKTGAQYKDANPEVAPFDDGISKRLQNRN
jgi:hypothetical protein